MTKIRYILYLLFIMLLLPAPIKALGIGQPRIHSYLGEPLRITVPLLLDDETHKQLHFGYVGIANRDMFNSLGQPLLPTYSQLEIQVRGEGREVRVDISSSYPVNEPLIELPLEINIGTTRLVRMLTLLVDPPPQQLRVVSSPAHSRQLAEGVRVESPVAITKDTQSPPAWSVTARQQGRQYGPVAVGQSLAGVLADILDIPGYREATDYQILVALWSANRAAFLHRNMNNMMAGSILHIPALEEVLDYDAAAAKQEVMAQYRAAPNSPYETVRILRKRDTAVSQQIHEGAATRRVATVKTNVHEEALPTTGVAMQPAAREGEVVARQIPTVVVMPGEAVTGAVAGEEHPQMVAQQLAKTEVEPRLKIVVLAAPEQVPPEFREAYQSLLTAQQVTERENSELRERLKVLEKQVAALTNLVLVGYAGTPPLPLVEIERQREGGDADSGDFTPVARGEVMAASAHEYTLTTGNIQAEGESLIEVIHGDDGDAVAVLPAGDAPYTLPGEDLISVKGNVVEPPSSVESDRKLTLLVVILMASMSAIALWFLFRYRQWQRYRQLFSEESVAMRW